MRMVIRKAVEFLRKEDGPTAVEYAVMLALIVVVCIAAITQVGKGANRRLLQRGAEFGGQLVRADFVRQPSRTRIIRQIGGLGPEEAGRQPTPRASAGVAGVRHEKPDSSQGAYTPF